MGVSFEEGVSQLSQPGGPFATKTVDVAGMETEVFENAPPSLRAIFDSARVRGDETFLVYEDERWSFAKTMGQVDALGALLVERYGVQPGDRVAIAMRNYPEWIVSFAGITSVGAISVSMNAWWTEAELRYGVEDSGAKVLIVDEARARDASTIAAERGLQVLVVRAEGADVERVVVLAQHGRAHNHHAEHREPAESAEAKQRSSHARRHTSLFMATLHRGVT